MSQPTRYSDDNMLTKLLAFTEHGFRLAISYRLNFASRYVALLTSIIFFYFLAKVFRASSNSVLQNYGGDYFAFLLLGGAFSVYLSLCLRIFSEQLREELLLGTLEPLVVTATPMTLSLLGPAIWAVLEGTLIAVLQLAIGAIFFGADFSHANWLSVLVVSLISIVCLVAWGIVSASFTIIFKRSDPINWLVGAITYVFSGVFFPIAILPQWLQVVSYLIPLTYALEAMRGAMLIGRSLIELGLPFIALVVFTMIMLPLSIYSLQRAINYLRETGSLSHY
jgi:ABC-2 type transport system permease protein